MIIPFGVLKHVGLWFLSVLLAGMFAYYLTENTTACRFLNVPESETATTTGRFIERVRGSYIRYSFVANGKTFVAAGWVGKKPMDWVEAGNPLIVSYDPRNPSINVLEVTDAGADCYESGIGSFLAVLLCSILSVAARIFLFMKERGRPVRTRVPRAAAIAAEIQNTAALATSACLFWISVGADIYKFPQNMVMAVLLSSLPVLWGVLAARGLREGGRVGWFASIVGDVISFVLLIWCGMRAPLALGASGALLGAPLILLLLPHVVRFYSTATRDLVLRDAVPSGKGGTA